MDIKSINSAIVGSRISEQAKSTDKQVTGNASGKTSSAHADKVTLTSLSQTPDLEAKAAASKVDNSAKIASIKTAISNGSYQVDAQSIANKLIQTETLIAGA